MPGTDLLHILAAAETGIAGQALSFFREGGFFMILLGLCSVAGIAAILFKFLSLRREQIAPHRLEQQIWDLEEETEASRALVEDFHQGRSVLARLAAIAVRHRGRRQQDISEPVQAAARAEIVRMHSGMTMLDVIITVAPLLGLLGTASGLVVVFSGLENDADRTAIALGIGRALKTTIVGLAIAVPAIVAQGFFQRRIDTYAARLELALTHLAQVCERWSKPEGR